MLDLYQLLVHILKRMSFIGNKISYITMLISSLLITPCTKSHPHTPHVHAFSLVYTFLNNFWGKYNQLILFQNLSILS